LARRIEGATSIQLAVGVLRDEVTGLADSFEKRLKETDTELLLERTTFGDENRLRTYKEYRKWVSRSTVKVSDSLSAIVTVYNSVNEFQKSDADLSGARRIRNQIEEIFNHLISVYGQIRKTKPPQLFNKSHEMFKNDIHAFVIDFVKAQRMVEESFEKGMSEHQTVKINLRLSVDDYKQASDEELELLEEKLREKQVLY